MSTDIGMDMKKNGFTLSVEKCDTSQFYASFMEDIEIFT
jgi:hypothetical protein